MRRLKRMALILMLTAGVASLAACGRDRTAADNNAGTTNEATDGTDRDNVVGGAAKDIADDAKDAAEDAKDTVRDAVDGDYSADANRAVGNGNTAQNGNADDATVSGGSDVKDTPADTDHTADKTTESRTDGKAKTDSTAKKNSTTTDNNNR